ncbi:MAG: hypothetical protein ACO3HC_05055 [Flavobacteriaceae bacterium]
MLFSQFFEPFNIFIDALSVKVHGQDFGQRAIRGNILFEDINPSTIAIYNFNSREGTYPNNQGQFTIPAQIDDILLFRSLQIAPIDVVVSESIYESGQMTVQVTLQVNILKEVIVRPHDLTGYLDYDVQQPVPFDLDFESIEFAIANSESIHFAPDASTSPQNQALPSTQLVNGLNVFTVLNIIMSPLIKVLSPQNKQVFKNKGHVRHWSDQYSDHELIALAGIELSELSDFIFFVDQKGFPEELWTREPDLEMMEFIKIQGRLFLNRAKK